MSKETKREFERLEQLWATQPFHMLLREKGQDWKSDLYVAVTDAEDAQNKLAAWSANRHREDIDLTCGQIRNRVGAVVAKVTPNLVLDQDGDYGSRYQSEFPLNKETEQTK